MKEPSEIVVFITTADEQEAKTIANLLLEQKKVACANIVPMVSSIFRWRGKLESENEGLLILKTKISLLNDVVSMVKSAHSYDAPEIIALPIIGGNPDYLNWINEETE
jgi:periplasmic divalent cation tolerance protein|tara:strand:- start:293 stop:616 length:324 start_codon:yes stop_codon:yes gene_type:complete